MPLSLASKLKLGVAFLLLITAIAGIGLVEAARLQGFVDEFLFSNGLFITFLFFGMGFFFLWPLYKELHHNPKFLKMFPNISALLKKLRPHFEAMGSFFFSYVIFSVLFLAFYALLVYIQGEDAAVQVKNYTSIGLAAYLIAEVLIVPRILPQKLV